MDSIGKSVTHLEEILLKSKDLAERHFKMPSDREKRMTILAVAKMLTELEIKKQL